MAFKHRFLEGSTFLFQYSSMTRAPLESCPLGELKYTISSDQDVRLKNKSVRKCKNWHCETSVHCHCIVHRSKKVWTSQNRCEVLFFLNRESHALQIWPTPETCLQFPNRISLGTLRPSEVVESGLRHASVCVRCELVWSATFLRCTTTSEILLESSLLGGFECEISAG